MTDSSEYTPPAVWQWDKESGGRFANINRPIAGPTHDKELPVGKHPLQLYSLATPNGVKVTVMLSPVIFTAVVEEIFMKISSDSGININRQALNNLRFTDDIILFANKRRTLATTFESTERRGEEKWNENEQEKKPRSYATT